MSCSQLRTSSSKATHPTPCFPLNRGKQHPLGTRYSMLEPMGDISLSSQHAAQGLLSYVMSYFILRGKLSSI